MSATAVKCPVCGGSGTYYIPPPWGQTSVGTSKTCHGCGGKGWVEVGLPPEVTIDFKVSQ